MVLRRGPDTPEYTEIDDKTECSWGWESKSVIGHALSVHEALGSFPALKMKKGGGEHNFQKTEKTLT